MTILKGKICFILCSIRFCPLWTFSVVAPDNCFSKTSPVEKNRFLMFVPYRFKFQSQLLKRRNFSKENCLSVSYNEKKLLIFILFILGKLLFFWMIVDHLSRNPRIWVSGCIKYSKLTCFICHSPNLLLVWYIFTNVFECLGKKAMIYFNPSNNSEIADAKKIFFFLPKSPLLISNFFCDGCW